MSYAWAGFVNDCQATARLASIRRGGVDEMRGWDACVARVPVHLAHILRQHAPTPGNPTALPTPHRPPSLLRITWQSAWFSGSDPALFEEVCHQLRIAETAGIFQATQSP